MFKCNECGNIFAEDELAEWNENRGEFWGMPAYERMTGCPACHCTGYDDYEEGQDE